MKDKFSGNVKKIISKNQGKNLQEMDGCYSQTGLLVIVKPAMT